MKTMPALSHMYLHFFLHGALHRAGTEQLFDDQQCEWMNMDVACCLEEHSLSTSPSQDTLSPCPPQAYKSVHLYYKGLTLGGLKSPPQFWHLCLYLNTPAVSWGSGKKEDDLFGMCTESFDGFSCVPAQGPASASPGPLLCGSLQHLSEALGARMTLASRMSSESPGDRESAGSLCNLMSGQRNVHKGLWFHRGSGWLSW